MNNIPTISLSDINLNNISSKKYVAPTFNGNIKLYEHDIDYSNIHNADPKELERISNIKKWYDIVQDIGISYYSSLANCGVAALEGITMLAESFIDAATILTGGVGSLLLGSAVLARTGDFGKAKEATVDMFNETARTVAYDLTGAAFDKLYETGAMKAIESNAWSPFKREDGIGYKIVKEATYYGGQIAIGTFAGGATGVKASQVLVAEMTKAVPVGVTMGVTSFGKQSQKNLSSAYKENDGADLTGKQILTSEGKALAKGVLDGGTYIVASGVGGTVGKVLEKSNVSRGVEKSLTLGQKLLKKTSEVAIKDSKALGSELINVAGTGEKYNWQNVGVDVAATTAAEYAAFAYGESHIGKTVNSFKFKNGAVEDGSKIVEVQQLTGGGSEAADTVSNAQKSTAEELKKLIAKSVEKGFYKGVEKDVKNTTSELVKSGVEALSS